MTPMIKVTGPRLSVAGILRRPDGSVLLARRAHEPGRGLWAFPGGKVRAGESLGEAVRREFFEETGIMVRPLKLTYVAEIIRSDFHYVVLDYTVEADVWEGTASSDADALAWVAKAQINDVSLSEGMADCLADAEVRQAIGWINAEE